jgi:hypothetical protein
VHPGTPVDLIAAGIVDARTAALLWLLTEGGVPLVAAGPAGADERSVVLASMLSADPARAWVVIDADAESLTTERLSALLRGGVSVGVTLGAADLEAVLEHLAGSGLPEDAIRRLGAVLILAEVEVGLRCTSAHYLRPTERDGQGHLQRRPPAVLSAWDETADAFEDYAWGITPELADLVDRAQADLEERQSQRSRFLAGLDATDDYSDRVRAYLTAEPPRVPAPAHERARPSPFSGGLTDPEPRPHQH